MYFVIPSLIPGSVNATVAQGRQRIPFVKRGVDVNETVSTVVALVYLALWIAGMVAVCVLCCRGRPRGRMLYLNLPWRGERGKGKQPEKSDIGLKGTTRIILVKPSDTAPQQEDTDPGQKHYSLPNSWGLGGMNESQRDGRDEPWMDGCASRAPRDLALSPEEESAYGRGEPVGGGRVAFQEYGPPVMKYAHATVPAVPEASGSKQHDVSPPARRVHFLQEPYSPQDARGEKYGSPVHQVASAATSNASLRLDSPYFDGTDTSSHVMASTLDNFPPPPQQSDGPHQNRWPAQAR